METPDMRQIKGQTIAAMEGQILRIDEHTYKVVSQSRKITYAVVATESGWQCECPDHLYRGTTCKHIWAVRLSQALRQEVKDTVISEVKVHACITCGSDRIIKKAIRHNLSGDIQRYVCKDCGKRFSLNFGFERMKASPEAITSAMQLYFTGESLRGVQKFLRLQGIEVSHVAVYKWIRKYVALMENYLAKMTPRVSDAWRTDELYIKVKGNMKYLFAMMDDQTRFWIAQQVADHKGTSDVRPMFREAMQRTGKRPSLLISDGAHNFRRAFNKEIWTSAGPRPSHLRDIRFGGEVHNNKMERLNGEIRDREKVVRGLKKSDSPILRGYQIYHNFIRPHEGLKGETPADRAGIKVEGSNKWLTIIQNASHDPTVNRVRESPSS